MKMKITRFVILIPIVFFIFSTICNAQMRQVYLDNVPDNEIHKSSFFSPSTGYVAFRDWIGYSSDSGHTFIKKYITTGNVNFNGNSVNLTFGFGISGVHAFTQNRIVVYGDYGLVPSILLSTDGGNSFLLVYHSQYNSLQLSTGIEDLIFPGNGNTGFAVDADRILRSTNQGSTWSVVFINPQRFFNKIESTDAVTILAMSTDPTTHKAYKSINGGTNWVQLNLPSANNERLMSGYFLNSSTGWICMRDYNNNLDYIYQTINGGTTWIVKNNVLVTPFLTEKMHFIDVNTGFALSDQNTVFKTINGGALWEPFPRNNNYSYLGYSHNDLQCYSSTQLWAGGGHGFLELNTNAGGPTLPRAFFLIDTLGIYINNTVNLMNYSKTTYSYRWLLNNVQISTSYNSSYIHNVNSLTDTIKLIVSNGQQSDTATKIINFPPPLTITSFTPTIGTLNTLVTITGTNFYSVTGVSFGGIPAALFNVISATQINAYTNNGATGNVTVTNGVNQSSKPGFTYYAPVTSNINYSVSDSIICKSKSITVTIHNSQPNVRYDLIDTLYNYYGFANGGGNGGDLSFQSIPINNTRRYQVIGNLININSATGYSIKKTITVEHTRSYFAADRVNITPNEKVNLKNLSVDAQSFLWNLNQDPNITITTVNSPQNIFYATPGQKTLTLISTSINGCKDTLNSNAVYVYSKPSVDDVCYALSVNDSDYYYQYGPWEQVNKMLLAPDNGYYVSGFGNKPILNSRYGNNKTLDLNDGVGAGYFAKYTTNGVLSWYTHIKSYGKFDAVDKDANGNIYIVGNSNVNKYLKLPNGDSLRVSASPADTLLYNTGQNNIFILKLDSLGKYLWHTIIADPNGPYALPPNIGFKTQIKIKGNQVIVAGNFVSKLAYSRNGLIQTLINLADSSNPGYPYGTNQFVMSIQNDGSLLWHTYFLLNTTNQVHEITALGIDNNKNVFLSGIFETNILIHDVGNVNNVTYNSLTGSRNSFLLKFDSTGKLKYHVKAVNPFSFKNVSFRDFVVDDAGNAYITGSNVMGNSSDYFTFTNSNGTNINIPFAPYFLMKLNPAGMYSWAVGNKFLDNTSRPGGYSVTLNNGNVFTTGSLNEISTNVLQSILTSTNGVNIKDSIPRGEFFIAKYDTSGVLKRFNRSGPNEPYRPSVRNLLFDNQNNFIIQGKTYAFTFVNPLITVFNQNIPYNGNDLFFTKLNADYCSQSTLPVANAGPDKSICNSQGVDIGVPAISGNHYYWTSLPQGFVSTIANPTVSPSVNTTYFLNVINSSGYIASDTVIVTTNGGAVANAGADQSICNGNSALIGSSPISGNIYSWSSIPAGFVSVIANPTVSPTTSTLYIVQVSNNGTCVARDSVLITVNNQFVSAVTIVASSNNTCSNSLTTFTATPTNGGATPIYQWKVNGVNAGTNNTTFTTNSLQNNDQVTVIMTSSLACASPANVTSNMITMTVTPAPVANAGNDVNICSGSSTQLIGSGGTTYSWSPSTGLNNANISNPIASPSATTAYILTVSNGNCLSRDTVLITVNSSAAPTVNISTGNTTICSGTSITFTATPTNGGSAPAYQWKVNGMNSGTNSPTFTTSALQGIAQVSVVMTSSLQCASPATATSNIVTMTVTPTPVANAGNNVSICGGSSTQLTGSGGIYYLWSPSTGLSNANIANPIASPLITTAYILTVSNGSCTSSDTVVVTVNSTAIPSVTISTASNNICVGNNVVFIAIAGNAGANPTYQWKVNGINAGISSATFATSSLLNNDQVRVIVTPSTSCTTTQNATSNTITMNVATLVQPLVSLNANLLTVTNPETGTNYTWQVLSNTVWGNVIPLATGVIYTSPQAGEYRVKAVKAACISYSASQISAITNPFDSTLIYISLNPNPTHGLITVSKIVPSQKWQSLEVLNLQGQIVLPSKNVRGLRSVQIRADHLAPGLYFVRLTNEDGRILSYRFIKE